MIRIENYKKYFDKHLVLDIPGMVLEKGIYWLQGENGSGKTTLMKSIAGLIPFDGKLEVDSVSIKAQRAEYKSKVNYAEAEPLYPDFLTGEDLIRFYMSSKQGQEHRVQTLMEALGINSFVDKKIGTYSSGMAKKLSLVLSFIGRPALILLDEPLITLDSMALMSLQQMIGDYHSSGVSFIITSHQQITLSGVNVSHLLVANKTLKEL